MADRDPVADKELRGNPGNRPTSTEAKSKTGPPAPPDDLKGEAYAEWCRVTTFLEKVGQIEKVDYAALMVYCSAWGMFDDARREFNELGPLLLGRDGGYVKNPAAQIMNDASKIMLAFGAKFGVTPKDRQNMGIVSTDPNEKNDLQKELAAL